MTCKKCGAEILEDASFCVNCGAAVEQPAQVSETKETLNLPSEDVKVEQVKSESTFQKRTMLGNITYKRVTTRVAITESGLQIEKKTKKIFRKEKTEERVIPFSQMHSASIHTVLDYWDTLYGVAFTVLGFLFHWSFFLLAIVFFWCGYGKKMQFVLKSGEKYSFPYKSGKEEAIALANLCNKNSKAA